MRIRQKMTTSKRLMAWVLSIMMILSLVPANVFAAENETDLVTQPDQTEYTADVETTPDAEVREQAEDTEAPEVKDEAAENKAGENEAAENEAAENETADNAAEDTKTPEVSEEAEDTKAPEAQEKAGNTFAITVKDTGFIIGTAYDFGAEAEFTATPELTDAEKPNYRVTLKSVDVPAGGSYVDTTGLTTFTPTYADQGLTYTAHYIMEVTADDGNTWTEITGTDADFSFAVKEQDYVVGIDGLTNTSIQLNTKYTFLNDNISVNVDPTPLGGVLFEPAVKKIKTPAGGSYTYKDGDTDFTPTGADKNKTYTVTYVVKKSIDGGTTWTEVAGTEATADLTIIGAAIQDEITSDDAKINSLKVEISDGTPGWDSDDTPGNDSSNTNKIVRTFDSVTYNLIFSTVTHSTELYRHGRIYFEFDLPYTEYEAQFDTAAMGLMDNHPDYMWEVDKTSVPGHQILKCYYELNETQDENGAVVEPIPNQGSFPVYVNIYAMKNGEQVQPTFTASVAYTDGEGGEKKTEGAFDVPNMVKADPVVVSAAPSYNVQLVKANDAYVSAISNFDFSTGNDKALDKSAGNVYGRLQAYGLTLQLYNSNKDKKLKGIEMPSGDITFTVDLSAEYKGEVTGKTYAAASPLVWSYGPQAGGTTQIDGRAMPTGVYTYGVSAAPSNGSRTGNFTSSPKTGTSSCWNGGNWSATKTGDTVTFTVNNYVVNPFWFPSVNLGDYEGGKRYFDPATGVINIGGFSAGELFLVLPFGGDTDSTNPEYYPIKYGESGSIQATVTDANFSATSVTGQTANNDDQANKTDDKITVSSTIKRTGSWDNIVHYLPYNSSGDRGVDGVPYGTDFYSGTDSMVAGGKLGIRWGGANVPVGDSANGVFAANTLLKFDDEALIPEGGAPHAVSSPEYLNVTYLYAAKPDGTGWADDTEMKTYNEEDLQYYATLDALKTDGKICVGILSEWRTNGTSQFVITYPRSAANFTVKSDMSLAGNVYQAVSVSNVWHQAEYEKVTAANGGAFPSRLTMAVGEKVNKTDDQKPSVNNHKYMTYQKASYDENGFVAGSGGEYSNGDSLYIVPYTANIQKKVEQTDNSGNEKLNYDLSQKQSKADYIITPTFVFGEDVTAPTDFTTTVTIVDKLPAGLTYTNGSAVYGGTYVPNADKGLSGTVTGGTAMEPTIVTNADGSQVLTWVIENVNIGEEMEKIHYTADIDQATVAGTSYPNTATIQTTEDKRDFKGENGNLATAKIQINAPAMLVAKKKADRLFNDPDQAVGFTMQWTNTSVNMYRDIVFMDTMPDDGDKRGSKFSGTYTVTGDIELTFPKNKTAADYTFYYTTDEAAKGKSSVDFTYADFTGATATSGGVTWKEAPIGTDGKVTALDGVRPTAWVILGSLSSTETLAAHINITPTGNVPEDKYVNEISAGDIVTTATSYTVLRQVAGMVWLDKNYDGKRDSNEQRMGGVKVELMMKNAAGDWVQATDVNGTPCASVTTDNVGSYFFNNLPDGEFKVVFSSDGVNLGEYRTTTVKATGVSQSVNSDAEPVFTADGILETAEITGINMPKAESMTSSPFIIRYQDLGLTTPAIPTKVYDDTKSDIQFGDIVEVGDNIPYKITYGNDDTIDSADITIVDTIDPGLTVVKNSISDGGVYDETTRTITWVLKDVAPKTFNGFVTFTATVNSEALKLMEVVNGAKVTYDYKNVTDRTYEVGPLVNVLVKKDYAEDTPAGAGQGQVNVGDEIGYQITYKNATKAEATIKITDVLDKGLTVDETTISDGGTFTADPTGATGGTITWDFKVPAETNGAVTFRAVVNENAFDSNLIENEATVSINDRPTVTTDKIVNPVPEKEYDEGTESGAEGEVVEVGDRISYKINYANYQKDADGNEIAVDVIITDVLDKGLTLDESTLDATAVFTPDPTGATGGTIVWTIPNVAYGTGGNVTFTGVVNENAVYTVDNSSTVQVGENDTITTNELRNPIGKKDYNNPEDADKDYEVNTPVAVGESIPYKVSFENVKDEAQDVSVEDTFSKGLTYNVDAAITGKDYSGNDVALNLTASEPVKNADGTVTVTWTVKDVPAKTRCVLAYSATVNKDAETEQIVNNDAKLKYGNEQFVHIGSLRNPVPSKNSGILSTGNTASDGAPVKPGMEIPYVITYANGLDADAEIVITDTMSKGLSYVAGTAMVGDVAQEPDSVTVNADGTTTLIWTIANVGAGQIGQLSYTALVTEDAVSIVENNASVDFGNDHIAALNPIKNPLPEKDYQEGGYGDDHISVEIGKAIDYKITFDHVKDAPAKVVITDTMSKGLVYTKGNAVLDGGIKPDAETLTENADGSMTVVWTFENVAKGSHLVTYQGTVTEDAVIKVNNRAEISYNNGSSLTLDELENPVPGKSYGDDTTDNQPLESGREVSYKINYANKTSEDQEITITDTSKITSGKGTFTYVAGSAKLADGTPIEPVSITDNADGGQTLVWELGTIPTGTEGDLTYTAKLQGTGTFENGAILTEGDNAINMKPVKNPIPEKIYGDDTQMGDLKVVGTEIPYAINFANTSKQPVKAVITDTMSTGLEYVAGSAKLDGAAMDESVETVTKNSDGSTTIVWTLDGLETGEHTVSYSGKVTQDAVKPGKVENTATVSFNNGPAAQLEKLPNTVPSKQYGSEDFNTDAPVLVGTEIPYVISFGNTRDTAADMTVTDTMSKGLTYVAGSANIEPSEVKTNVFTGKTTVIWKLSQVKPGEIGQITYKAKVNDKSVSIGNIENNASVKYDDSKEVDLESLKKPVTTDPTQSGASGNSSGDTSGNTSGNTSKPGTSGSLGSSSGKGPKTGDSNSLGMWMILLLASGTVFAGVVIARKKKRS